MTAAHYRAAEYRRKAQECLAQVEGAKHSEIKESWKKLVVQWEHLAQELHSASQQAQQPPTKERP